MMAYTRGVPTTRPDDPDGVMAHAGRYAGGVALIVLGGPSGEDWQRVRDDVNPDVILTANGSTSIAGADYWMLAENMKYQYARAQAGDARGVAFMRMLNSPNTAKTRLVSHRSWSLLEDKTDCVRIRRMGYERGMIPESFSLREYGEGYLNGWMFQHLEAARPDVVFRVGTVGLQLLHHAGILGVREVHTVGYDLMFKGEKHHWYEYPKYEPDRFTTHEMFVSMRYGRDIVDTRWAWVETAVFMRSIEYLFERAELKWVDHSDGLLKYEGCQCARRNGGRKRNTERRVYERRRQNSAIEHSKSPQTFAAHDHQGKGKPFVESLQQAGHTLAGDMNGAGAAGFVLTDHAIMGRADQLARLRAAGAQHVFVYPHTARPNVVNDILFEFEGVTAHFVSAKGHVEVMRAYGYEKPLHVVGWSLCPLKRFKPRKWAHNVLFAPIHPRCDAMDQDVNRAAFSRLLKLARADDIKLTVRHVGELAGSGLERVDHPNVTYTPGGLAPNWSQIDEADVVVGHQTFAWMAVARGVPTVMMAEDMPAHLIPRGKAPLMARNWNQYAHLLAFPLDLLGGGNPLTVLQKAVRGDLFVAEWRARMIGEAFCPEKVVRVVENYVA